MPKIIDDLKNTLIAEGREILFTQGYQKLTIRSLAKSCHVAVGTIYNYFDSKEMLLAAIMLEDWLKATAGMQNGITQAKDPREACYAIYRGVREFAGNYREAWKESGIEMGSSPFLYERHQQLLDQLTGLLLPYLKTHGASHPELFSKVLLERILEHGIAEEDDFTEVSVILDKLMN